MKRYHHFPAHIGASLARPSRLKVITALVEDGNPADHLERLRFHPALAARLLIDGSLSPSIFERFPELLVPALQRASDKFAFVILAEASLGSASEGMLTEYVLAARGANVPDSLLEGALDRIRSPWRLDALGYHVRAAALREAKPDDVRVRFSDYIASGAIRTAEEFDGASQLSAEDLYEYCAVRLTATPHLPVDLRLLEGASAQFAYNLLRPGGNVVTPSNTPILTVWEVVASAQANPIWALEYVLAKCHGDAADSAAIATEIALWAPDPGFGSVASAQLREELASILT